MAIAGEFNSLGIITYDQNGNLEWINQIDSVEAIEPSEAYIILILAILMLLEHFWICDNRLSRFQMVAVIYL